MQPPPDILQFLVSLAVLGGLVWYVQMVMDDWAKRKAERDPTDPLNLDPQNRRVLRHLNSRDPHGIHKGWSVEQTRIRAAEEMRRIRAAQKALDADRAAQPPKD